MDDNDRRPNPDELESGTDPPRLMRGAVYEKIKDAIRHAQLAPGQPLSESALSKRFGISRTPVREALQMLALEGLVQLIPGRAVTVAAPSIQEVLNIVHIRSILEPEVIRLAAQMIPPADLRELWNALGEMERALEEENRLAWSKADTRFHEILSGVCPNKLLGELAIQMRNRVAYVAVDSQTTNDRMKACTEEHRQIVEAIDAGDSQAADKFTRIHIRNIRESLFRRLPHS